MYGGTQAHCVWDITANKPEEQNVSSSPKALEDMCAGAGRQPQSVRWHWVFRQRSTHVSSYQGRKQLVLQLSVQMNVACLRSRKKANAAGEQRKRASAVRAEV